VTVASASAPGSRTRATSPRCPILYRQSRRSAIPTFTQFSSQFQLRTLVEVVLWVRSEQRNRSEPLMGRRPQSFSDLLRPQARPQESPPRTTINPNKKQTHRHPARRQRGVECVGTRRRNPPLGRELSAAEREPQGMGPPPLGAAARTAAAEDSPGLGRRALPAGGDGAALLGKQGRG